MVSLHRNAVRKHSIHLFNETKSNFYSTDRQNDKLQIYNLSQIGPDRKWLQDILLSDTETEPEPSDEDEYIRDMLKEHVKEKKIRAKYYRNPHVSLFFIFISLFAHTTDFNRAICCHRTHNMATTVRVFCQMWICIKSIKTKSSV